MKKKHYLIFGLIVVLFGITCITGYVKGAPPPLVAKFSFEIDKDFVKEGNWILNFVTIPNYRLDDLDGVKNYFFNLKNEYIKVKRLCGLSSDFEYKTGYGLRATKEECDPYKKHVQRRVTDHTITFNQFHYTYLVDNRPGDSDYPRKCDLSKGTCQIIVGQEYDSKNPHFGILEKLNSNEEIYFSEPINIPWDYLEKVEWSGDWESKKSYLLKLTKFEIEKPNRLLIQFEGAEAVKEWKLEAPIKKEAEKEATRTSLYYFIVGIVILIIIVIIIIWITFLKRKK